jgi:hypothetical protein
MSLAFAGKCMAVAVACAGVPTKPVTIHQLFSFLTKHRVKYTCEPCGRSNWEIYSRHCQGCEKNRNQGGKEGNFWNGHCRSFCCLLPVSRGRVPAALSHGGCDRKLMAASSVPQDVHGFHNSCGCLVVACADRLPHGRM